MASSPTSFIEECTDTVVAADTRCSLATGFPVLSLPVYRSITVSVSLAVTGGPESVGAFHVTEVPVPVNVPASAVHWKTSPVSEVSASVTTADAVISPPDSANPAGWFAPPTARRLLIDGRRVGHRARGRVGEPIRQDSPLTPDSDRHVGYPDVA